MSQMIISLLYIIFETDAFTGFSNNFKTMTVAVGTRVYDENIYGMSTYNNINGIATIRVNTSGSSNKYYYDIITGWYSSVGSGMVGVNYASYEDNARYYKVNVIYTD